MDNKAALEKLGEALSAYNEVFPFEEIGHKGRIFGKTPVQEREEVWKKLGLPVDELSARYRELIEARNGLAQAQGFANFIEARLDKYGISKASYESFRQNIEEIIGHCRKLLPGGMKTPGWFYSEYSQPCYICLLKDFPFASLEEAQTWLEKQLLIDRGDKERVDLLMTDSSYTIFNSEEGRYEVGINKEQNIRHQVLDLVHEYAHVAVRTRSREGEMSRYESEKEAGRLMFELLRQLSGDLFKAYMVEVLLLVRKNLFEIMMYENSKNDPGKIYAETFNQCFPEASQTSNNTYLLDEMFVMRPLRSLPHVVAQTEILMNL